MTGGLIHQSDFELKRVLSQRSEINNTLTPSSPSSLKYTAFLDVSVGGFGWICLFSQGGDNTNKKVKQLESGTLQMFSERVCFDCVIRNGRGIHASAGGGSENPKVPLGHFETDSESTD